MQVQLLPGPLTDFTDTCAAIVQVKISAIRAICGLIIFTETRCSSSVWQSRRLVSDSAPVRCRPAPPKGRSSMAERPSHTRAASGSNPLAPIFTGQWWNLAYTAALEVAALKHAGSTPAWLTCFRLWKSKKTSKVWASGET